MTDSAERQNDQKSEDALAVMSQWLNGKDETLLARALTQRPDLMEGLARALGAAKKRQAQMQETQDAVESGGEKGAQDPKLWNKLKKLVESPFNDVNRKAFDEIAAVGIDWQWAPENAPTILRASLDYLAEKDRVELDWPAHVLAAAKTFGVEEWQASEALQIARTHYSLGGRKLGEFLASLLSCDIDWPRLEEQAGQSALAVALRLASEHEYEERRFAAVRLVAERGASFERFEASIRQANAKAPQNAPVVEFWQQMMELGFRESEKKNRLDLMKALIALKQVRQGYACAPEGVPEKNGATRFSVGPARAYLPLIRSSRQEPSRDWGHHSLIFSALCEMEDQELRSPRLDRWGMSRLRWSNEICSCQSASDLGQATDLMAAALRHGDEPESIAWADPVACAKTEAGKKLVKSALERKELMGVAAVSSEAEAADGAAPARAARSATRL